MDQNYKPNVETEVLYFVPSTLKKVISLHSELSYLLQAIEIMTYESFGNLAGSGYNIRRTVEEQINFIWTNTT